MLKVEARSCFLSTYCREVDGELRALEGQVLRGAQMEAGFGYGVFDKARRLASNTLNNSGYRRDIGEVFVRLMWKLHADRVGEGISSVGLGEALVDAV